MKKSAKQQNRKKKRRSRSAARRSIKDMLRFLPIAAPLIMTAFIYMWQHTRANIVGAPVEKLRARKMALIKQNDSIRVQIEKLQAPGRIESIAQKKLGMIAPQEYRLIALDEPMRPPGVELERNAVADADMQTSREPERRFGFLKPGFLKKKREPGSAPEKTASTQTGRQSG